VTTTSEIEVFSYLKDLNEAGAVTATSLDLSNPGMAYTRWESLGRFLGQLGRSSNWWIGDWLIFGESVFGQEAYQAVDATTLDRYSIAERVTGL
jgi:hypothetical protein